MPSSGMLRHVALVRTDVSKELSASIIRVTRISELVTANVVPNSPILSHWCGGATFLRNVGSYNSHTA
jgi:hypothetical protein